MRTAMRNGLLVWVALVLNVVITIGNTEAAIVYDDTSKQMNYWAPTYQSGFSVEAGDQITLAGTDRYITAIDVVVFQSYSWASGTVDAQIRFYKNDGRDGAPGSVIWDSGVIQNIPYFGDYNTFSFSAPRVLVPETFTWTIKFSNVQTYSAYNIGLPYYGTPTVGSSGDYVWQYDGTSWTAMKDTTLVNFGGTLYASGGPFQDILAFFDASVANSTVLGQGPENSANNRRGALRNMLAAAGGMAEKGDANGACGNLKAAYLRCDGEATPLDFVEGPAVPKLAEMIRSYLNELGCQ